MESSSLAVRDLVHQLRGPLRAALRRAASLLERDVPPDLKMDLYAVRGLCAKANRIAEGASLFAALTEGAEPELDRRPLRTIELARTIIEAASDTATVLDPARRIRIDVDRASIESGATLVVDPTLFSQALYGVLDNAAKYSYDGTTVSIRLRRTKAHVVVEVSNTGLRLEPSELKQVVRRGWRSAAARMVTSEGGGTGLWIVDRIMAAHGGSLRISPTDAAGVTRVELLFPADEAGDENRRR